MTWRIGLLTALLAVGFGAGWSVNDWRRDAEVLDLARERDAARSEQVRSEHLRLEAVAEALRARQELEDAAHADTDNSGGLPLSRVRRLRIE